MNILYRIAAQTLIGPWRDALASQFIEHADHEVKHADLAMRRIVALGGKIDTSLPAIPQWDSLDEIISGINKLEDEGIKAWQELLADLDSSDSFKHVVGGIIAQEQHHYDEAKRWQENSKKKTEDIEAVQPAVQEDIADLSYEAVVGDTRRLIVYNLSTNYIPDNDSMIGEAWQDDLGNLYGTGICEAMLFEPMAAMMYISSSIGLDKSPLSMLAYRLSTSPFARIEWQ